MKTYWRLWAKTLGPRISEHDHEANFAAKLRTAWIMLQIVTCLFIIANSGKNLGLWLSSN